MRVLLVEDDPSTQQSVTLMLESAGMVVDATDLGEDGLDLGKLYDYDIIVLDLMLPDMDGLELLRATAELTRERGIAVVVMSEQSDPSVAAQAIQLGAAYYLKKSELNDVAVIDLLSRAADKARNQVSQNRIVQGNSVLASVLQEYALPILAIDTETGAIAYKNHACEQLNFRDAIPSMLGIPNANYNFRADYLSPLRAKSYRMGQSFIYEGVTYQSFEHLYVDSEYSWLVITLFTQAVASKH